MNNRSEKTKLQTTTYSFAIALLISAISFLPYLHDFEIFKGKEGFSGFSSLRVAIWIISLFLVAISGWVFAYLNSKGKKYRFAMLAPIAMLLFQLFVYVLDERKSFVNDFNTKVILNFAFLLIIVVTYFLLKRRNE